MLCVLLLWAYGMDARGESWGSGSCQIGYERLSLLQVARPPVRVLLVPLLRSAPGTGESERWPESPAAIIAAFYRSRFKAQVTWLQDVRFWDDYYRQIGPGLQQPARFDRVIFIGHGGFDGPLLNEEVIRQELTVTGTMGKIYRAYESQQGLQQVLTVTYDATQNRAFSEYLGSHWQHLVRGRPADVFQSLKRLESRFQPLDHACFARHCSAGQLADLPSEDAREIRLGACESICRDPLFVLRAHDQIAPERFSRFAESLRSLLKPDGLIFFGQCNPGTVLIKADAPDDTAGTLIHSRLVGGPYESYVELLAASTGRTAAGPMGQSSAQDVVDRIMLLENDRPQRYLCIVTPRFHYPNSR
jgi:hypothetical protein